MAFSNTPALKRWLVILAAALSLAVIGGAGYFGYQTSQAKEAPPPPPPPTVPVSQGEVVLSVTAPGVSVNTRKSSVESRVSGTVEALLVQPGDAVKAGQVLARIGDKDQFMMAVIEAQIQVMQVQKTLDGIDDDLLLSQAALELAQAQKAYDKAKARTASKEYQHGDENSIAIARANWILANRAVGDAEEIYNRNKYRADDDPEFAAALSQLAAARQQRAVADANLRWLQSKPSANEVAQVQAQFEIAAAQLDAAQKKFDQLKTGRNPDRSLAEAQLVSAQARLQDARANLKNLEITAPFDGVITEVKTAVGQSAGAGTSLFTLIDPRALEVEATVVEEDFPLVEPGQAVDLYFDALPVSEVTGKVARVIPERVSGNQANYKIVITLDGPVEDLVAGMTVDGSIVISQQENVLRLPRSIVRARPDDSALVEVWANNQIEKRAVTVGLRGDSFTEVTGGLTEGEQVVAR